MDLDALKNLVSTLRETGVTRFSGPIDEAATRYVTLELAPLPPLEVQAPQPQQPAEPEQRGDDGLTPTERRWWYATSGG